MEIKILGGGCASCKKLEKLTNKALKAVGKEVEIIKVTDYQTIMSDYNVMTTPALVIDGDVKIKGQVPTYKEVLGLLQ